jgi:hypothetical protein
MIFDWKHSASYHGQLSSSAGVILMLEICAFDVAVVLAGVSLANWCLLIVVFADRSVSVHRSGILRPF